MTDLRPPKIVALLPMKRHSARVPNKNFRTFAGKPLFAWILEALLKVTDIDRIIINTDAVDLLEKHPLMGSERVLLRERRAEICGDLVSMNLIIEDDLRAIEADTYLMTHTTNPLLGAVSIEQALAAFKEGKQSGASDSLFTVNRYQTRFYRAGGTPINHDPANLLRTQDLEPWYEENSNLYIFSRASFEKTQARIGENPILFETPVMESMDIDDQEGWDLAEVLAKQRGI